MELAFLDKNFELIKYFKYINLQWIRRYYEPGMFTVQIPSEEYLLNAQYVYNLERPEVGIIDKFEYSKKTDGKLILLSGYFYEYKLNDKITYPRFNKVGNIENVARSIVETYKDDIPLLKLANPNEILLGTNITKQSTGDGLASALYSLLKTQQMSYRCVYNYQLNYIEFKVWQGLNRTQSQSENSFASFSEKLKNIQNEKITRDSSAYKNYAIVVGNGSFEDGKQIVVEVDLRANSDEYKKIVYIDKTSETFDESKETLESFKSKLAQSGKEELLKSYSNILNISFEALQSSGLRYLKDYDLGDVCDLLIDDFELAFTVRLTEVKEVIKNSVHTIELQFGDKVPVAYRR